ADANACVTQRQPGHRCRKRHRPVRLRSAPVALRTAERCGRHRRLRDPGGGDLQRRLQRLRNAALNGPCQRPFVVAASRSGAPSFASSPVAGFFARVSFAITVTFGFSQLPVTLYCACATELIALLNTPCSSTPAAAPTGPPSSAPPATSVPPTCGVASQV